MGFNRRKVEDQRREAAEKEAANRRATDAQVLEDAERLIGAWNERQAKRMPILFSPTPTRGGDVASLAAIVQASPPPPRYRPPRRCSLYKSRRESLAFEFRDNG
jgi:hypothetical protein